MGSQMSTGAGSVALRALLWDVDGTLAESERDGHLMAFNHAFEVMGLPWRWSVERYSELLRITGGRERMMADMAQRSDAPGPSERESLARQLHVIKNKRYAELVGEGQIPLRPGVRELLDEATAAGLQQAITTTTSRSNVQALLTAQLGPHWADRFAAVVCGEDVQRKKPDPEVFHLALQQMALSPVQALALEDSPGGVVAARAAGVQVVVTRSVFFADAPVEDCLAIGPGFHDRTGWQPALRGPQGLVRLQDLLTWRQAAESVSQFG